ncbi:hypothetical protein [Piscinibacter sp.]|uniref:hypothetical protein n=1 Tax=Piscinibacter sp. TaxID=1903157 RepID=UPI0039E43441
MKEYRLATWPTLGPQHRRTAYHRVLSDMSQRHVSLAELCAHSGLGRRELRQFLTTLAECGSLVTRDAPRTGWPLSLRPLRNLLRRTRVLSPRRA